MRKISIMLAALSVAILLISALPVLSAGAEASTLASWSFGGGTPEEAVEGGDKDVGYAAQTGSGTLFASVNGTAGRKLEWSKEPYDDTLTAAVMTGGTKNPWSVGAYFQVLVSTTGCDSVAFSAQLAGTKKGPRDWKLQYSTDGSSFIDVDGGAYALTDNRKMEQAYNSIALPAAAANQATLYIRMVVTSATLIGGEGTLSGSTGGEAAINNVTVTAGGATPTSGNATTATGAGSTTAGAATTTKAAAATTTAKVATTTTTQNANTGVTDVLPVALLIAVAAAGVIIVTVLVIRRKKSEA